MRKLALEAISGLGSTMLFVVPGSARGVQHSPLGAPLFTAGDLDALVHQASEIAQISAAGSQLKRVVAGAYHRTVSIAGVQPA